MLALRQHLASQMILPPGTLARASLSGIANIETGFELPVRRQITVNRIAVGAYRLYRRLTRRANASEALSMTRHAVQVDDRESAGPVADLLGRSPDFHVTVMRLKLGDYLVDGRFLFERKTLPDLVTSIISGRLFTQALRLAGARLRPALILEGTSNELAESGMRWEAVQGALITVTFFCAIPILSTRTPEETVRTMLFAAQQGRTYAMGSLPRPGYRPTGKRARQLFMLQGLPRIGPERANRLLARFGSVEAVIKASVEELCAVPGIGKPIAERIRWSVAEPFSAYRVMAAH